MSKKYSFVDRFSQKISQVLKTCDRSYLYISFESVVKKDKSVAIRGVLLPCVAFKKKGRVFTRLSIHSPRIALILKNIIYKKI